MRLNQVKKYLISSYKPYHRGFSLIDKVRADDLNLQVARLYHQKSGAMVYNLIANDNDNTFAPIVKTLPQNDTGCPHILQHLACCGSQKFPIRDPFFNMLKRSVNTYMNAWTGDDFTAYPFSSANPKDFANLYKVYLDMCLKPLLNELDFRQEGWRYEFNAETGLKQLKGIVFNQMKGAYQNPDRQLYVEVANKLFASTPFGHDSGGRPDSIVKLSYEDVKSMHKYYYHPSNMSFYYYGNQDIKDSLSFLEEDYLHKFDYRNDTENYQRKSSSLMQNMPQKLDKMFYTINSSTAQTPNVSVTFNISTIDKLNGIELSCLNILSYILLQTNQAILYQEFIQSGLADGFGMQGLNVGSVVSFSFTLKNVTIPEQQVLLRTERCLKSLIQKGVDQNRLQQYLIQAELNILTPKQTQGIRYLQSLIPFLSNRLSLTNLISVRSNLQAAVRKLKNKQELKRLINQHFLSNSKKIVIKQQPNKQKAEEYNNLTGLQIPEDIIKTQQAQLKKRQQSQSSNSTDCLPKLSLADLLAPKNYSYKIMSEGKTLNNKNAKDIHISIDKKDINFIKLVFTLDGKKSDNSTLLKFLDIWRYAIKEGIAVKGMSNKQVSAKLNLLSHNFEVKLQKGSNHKNLTHIHIVFSATCLNQTVSEFMNLLSKIIYEPDFKKEEISNIFRSYKSEKVQELLDGGVMSYCLDYGASFISKQGEVFNTYNLVTEGLKIAEAGEVPEQFKAINMKLQTQCDVTLIQHANQHIQNLLKKAGFSYQMIPVNQTQQDVLAGEKLQHQQKSIAVTNSYDVNFCTQQYPGPPHLSQEEAHLSLLVEVLEQDYLHPKIREKGGAYGARAVIRSSRTIAMYSYMDPYATQTYTAFDQSIKQLLNAQISQQRLQELKIKVLGALDKPIVPQLECYSQILKGFTTQQKNQYRKYIQSASWKQIIETGKNYFKQNFKSRVLFGRDVPKQFVEEKLKIPKQSDKNQKEGEVVAEN